MGPPIHLFLTTIASQPALRQRQEYLLRILQMKKIPFTSYDLASDEDAKRLWRRKAPLDKQQLPGILVGYQFVGTFAQFEEAVEYGELDQFLKLKEPWDPAIDEERPPPVAKPIGVPGAVLPMEMTPDHIKKHIIAEQQSPLRIKNKDKKPIPVNREDDSKKIDLGEEIAGYELQGLKVTEDELKDLIEQLGLGGDEADDLAKGLLSDEKGSKGKQVEKAEPTPAKEVKSEVKAEAKEEEEGADERKGEKDEEPKEDTSKAPPSKDDTA
ncbi:hypothetical protein CC1G_01736 [Coprinopsis cinerea okayama7|uniref:Uncharacterized protein n=1 Tax=Coprinopsis cinerea (strain Okayama-7 / 130 / ATCC MYA-4618 / FGSC 9003) TaxID=240176 RepID=A8N2L9_COPC7|nr:hypothetical protein CC1G_01736 [Coprinopsis cinerea okayama7\|eukprot:XP_001829056.2 hypothetical protein CC1G_01736 [Coprinopsis cinerea okayama7\